MRSKVDPQPTHQLMADNYNCQFQMSGRLIFGGYNDYLVHLWDTMQGVKVGCVFAHENRVTSLRRAPDGTAFATSSWDNTVKVWA